MLGTIKDCLKDQLHHVNKDYLSYDCKLESTDFPKIAPLEKTCPKIYQFAVQFFNNFQTSFDNIKQNLKDIWKVTFPKYLIVDTFALLTHALVSVVALPVIGIALLIPSKKPIAEDILHS